MGLRMRGAKPAPRPTPPPSNEPTEKRYVVDPITGAKLLPKDGYCVILRPPKVKAPDGEAKTADELAAVCHNTLVETWDVKDDVSCGGLATETYGLAVKLGFRGSMSAWQDNIEAGRIVRGEVDRIPQKVQRRIQLRETDE